MKLKRLGILLRGTYQSLLHQFLQLCMIVYKLPMIVYKQFFKKSKIKINSIVLKGGSFNCRKLLFFYLLVLPIQASWRDHFLVSFKACFCFCVTSKRKKNLWLSLFQVNKNHGIIKQNDNLSWYYMHWEDWGGDYMTLQWSNERVINWLNCLSKTKFNVKKISC